LAESTNCVMDDNIARPEHREFSLALSGVNLVEGT
jgi:hypothetical protein